MNNRSNRVFLDSPIKKNLTNYEYDYVYFGTPDKISKNTMKLDGPLFVTPLKGLASIFAVRPQHPSKYGVKPGYSDRGYLEWNSGASEYLKELHVYFKEAPYVPLTTEKVKGYVYGLKLTPELKQHIWWGNLMNSPSKEVVLNDLTEIKFDMVHNLEVKMYVVGVEGKRATLDDFTEKDVEVHGGMFEEFNHFFKPEYHEVYQESNNNDDGFKQHMIECYRVEYDGMGIYEALKQAMFNKTHSPQIWLDFLSSPACGWLPTPPSYNNTNASYFTEKGYNKFMAMTYPLMIQWLDQTKISINQVVIDSNNIIYEDEYQFITKEPDQEIQETKLSSKERNSLDNKDFGIPETRSYPLTDETHVMKAVQLFSHAPIKYRKTLAKRILHKAHEFNMDTSNWDSINKYIKE